MIDFAYDIEALPGGFPSRYGPFSLLKETRINYWGKLLAHPMYWKLILPGRPVPIPERFSMKGKNAV
jgi:sulfide:quinone oxidoreductase